MDWKRDLNELLELQGKVNYLKNEKLLRMYLNDRVAS